MNLRASLLVGWYSTTSLLRFQFCKNNQTSLVWFLSAFKFSLVWKVILHWKMPGRNLTMRPMSSSTLDWQKVTHRISLQVSKVYSILILSRVKKSKLEISLRLKIIKESHVTVWFLAPMKLELTTEENLPDVKPTNKSKCKVLDALSTQNNLMVNLISNKSKVSGKSTTFSKIKATIRKM